ncbi:Nucleoporin NDC1 [Chamberlinius hualienensis]
MSRMGNGGDNIRLWFYQEIYPWRLFGSFAVACSILEIFSVFVGIVLRIDIIHPLKWLQSECLSFFGLTTYLQMFLLFLLTAGLMACCSYTYKITPTVFLKRYEVINELFQLLNIALIILYAILGAFTVQLYLWIDGGEFNALVTSSEGESLYSRLNDGHLFAVFHGAFVAVMYAVDVIINNCNCFVSPIIQQRKFVRVKNSFAHGVKLSLSVILRRLKWFLFIYAVLGSSLCTWIISLMHLDASGNSVWNRFLNLLSVKLWWYTLVTGVAVYFMFHFLAAVYNIFQTEKITFPVSSVMESESVHTLTSAITCKDCPIVKLLGFMDLRVLTSQFPRRRQEIYRISSPGSHPIYWNVIATESLNLMTSLTKSLKTRFDTDYAAMMNEQLTVDGRIEHIYGNIPSKIYHDSPFSVKKFREHPKDVITSNFQPIATSFVPITTTVTSSIHNNIDEWRKKFVKLPVVAYWINEQPFDAANKIFADSQLYILIIESLTFLIIHSVNEDKYGVVQKDLPDIIAAMIDLQKAINHAFKNELGSSRRHHLNPKVTSLQISLKMSLYRIVTIFEDYLSALGLSSENLLYLTRYKEFEDY